MDRKYDCCVIGGGCSGWQSAMTIAEAGYSVIVLESRDRIGGRVFTKRDCAYNASVDLGGQWVGPSHTYLLRLCEDFGLDLIEQEYATCTAATTTPKEHISVHISTLVECANFRIISSGHSEVVAFCTIIQKLCDSIDLMSPWSHPQALEWDNLNVHEYIDATVENDCAKMEILLFVQTVFACAPDSCSFLFFLFYVASSGGMEALGDGEKGAQKWKITGGAQQICDLMSKKLSNVFGSRVVSMLSAVVISVEQVLLKETSAIVTYVSEDEEISISCKRVICAIAPPLLHNIRFMPALPEGKEFLCTHMIRASCIKVIVAYRNAFWMTNCESVISNEIAVEHVGQLGPIHNIFLGSYGSLPALVCLITGQFAQQQSLLPTEERRQCVLTQLAKMYTPVDCPDAFEPLAYLETDWCTEPFSAGCFAGIMPVGTLTTCGMELRSPFGAIYFAGTETATEFYGYIEGALRAGERAGQEVAESLKREA